VSTRGNEADRRLWQLSLILREIAENPASDGQEEQLSCQACAKDAQAGDKDEDGSGGTFWAGWIEMEEGRD
jgi:hypothetical protein